MRVHPARLPWLRLASIAASVGVFAAATHAQSVASGTSFSLAKGAPVRFEAGPPTSLGQHSIGAATRRAAMLSVADSVVRSWGWEVKSVDLGRSALRTEWLYFSGPDFMPTAGRQCGDDATVGLRLEVTPRRVTKDSAEFVVRGEALLINGRGRADAERFARAGFAVLTSALQDGARGAERWPDTYTAALERFSGEIGVRQGGRVHGCLTVRP
ncbi:MAG: hypothetical protein Q8K82_16500 [Gemmatimonadaceae bacterium]|nr:hypothetical protein [Gemmatimonadaceae bacterium]